MKKNQNLLAGTLLLVGFAVWTFLIQMVDVQPIGPNGSIVGFAALNGWFHHLTGVHWMLYTLTDWLGLVPIFVCLIFAGVGFVQLMQRKSLLKVDLDIILLGVYYMFVIFGYLLFEMMPINYRPVLIEGFLEASYPSSTTLLVLSVMPTLYDTVFSGTAAAYPKCAPADHLHLFCPVFCFYGHWAADFWCPLADRYYGSCSVKQWCFSDLQSLH